MGAELITFKEGTSGSFPCRESTEPVGPQNSTAKSNSAPTPPTFQTYGELQFAYSFFNERLFGNRLPDCLITLVRKRRIGGYFGAQFFKRGDGAITHEISLNPAYFEDQGDRFSLSVLVHEMVHLWRAEFGQPSKEPKP